MKLDIHEIYHNYIIRVVLFALFTYKRQIRQPNVYKLSVLSYTRKRIPWKINLIIDTGLKLDKEDEREILLQELLDGVESDYLSTVTVTFTTPLKQVTIGVDLKSESKYESFLYS
jgi:hypothetical protein